MVWDDYVAVDKGGILVDMWGTVDDMEGRGQICRSYDLTSDKKMCKSLKGIEWWAIWKT